MRFPKQESWKRLPFPSSGDLSDPGIQPMSPSLAGGFFTAEPPGKPYIYIYTCMCIYRWKREREKISESRVSLSVVPNVGYNPMLLDIQRNIKMWLILKTKGSQYTLLCYTKTHWKKYIRWVNYMLCELYLSLAVTATGYQWKFNSEMIHMELADEVVKVIVVTRLCSEKEKKYL